MHRDYVVAGLLFLACLCVGVLMGLAIIRGLPVPTGVHPSAVWTPTCAQ